MRLVDGADAIRGDLPRASTKSVDVPLEAGDDQGTGIHRMSSIALVRERLGNVLAVTPGVVVTIGGDCGVEVGAIGHVLARDQDVAVLWLDAHPDLNTAASSASHAFSGMVLRTLLGDGTAQLVPSTALSPERLVLAGARSFDAAEDEYIDANSVRTVSAGEISPESLIAAVEATGAASVYVHIDLDVIDPSDFIGIGYPEPFGVLAGVLVESLKALLARFRLAGAGITEFAPASAEEALEDMPTILRIVGALAAAAT
jgi:arginase